MDDPREIPGDKRDVLGGRLAGTAATALSLSVALISSVTLVLAWQSIVATNRVQEDLAASLVEARRVEQEHTCTSYRAQQLILQRIDAAAGSDVPAVLVDPPKATRQACKNAGISLIG